jgi:thiol-disulfide isomerase/thioredoxin
MASNLGESPINSPEQTASAIGTRLRNFSIALVAMLLGAALFFGIQNQNSSISLTSLDKESTPLEVALNNGKPTLVEFYANWCTVCQAMAPDLAQLKQQYLEQLNFVMLNVDNTKWLPEMLKYRVDGIPHFVFLGKDGKAIAQAIGQQPRSIMAANLEALAASLPLPYGGQSGAETTSGQVSKLEAPGTSPSGADAPRSHGSQVVN